MATGTRSQKQFYAHPLGSASLNEIAKEDGKEDVKEMAYVDEGEGKPGSFKRASKSYSTFLYFAAPQFLKGLFAIPYKWFSKTFAHVP